MKPEENDSLNQQDHLSQTGPNELNEEDLGLSETDKENPMIGRDNVADNENDTMEDPENDLDEEEVTRLFPGAEDPNKDADMGDLNETV